MDPPKQFCPTASQWTGWRISNELHQTYLLVWDEMFNEATLDSWQVRTCTVRSLLSEVVEAAQLAQTNEKFAHHIDPLIAETISAAAADHIAARACPFLSRSLKASKPLGAKILATTCEVALAHLDRHRQLTAEALKDILENGRPTEKERLVRLALQFGTELASDGHSLTHLRRSSRLLRSNPQDPFLIRFDRLVAACSAVDTNFVCEFALHAKLSDHSQRFDGIEIADWLRVDASPSARDFYEKVRSTHAIVRLTVAAPDKFEARRRAARQLGQMAAAIAVFRPEARTTLDAAEPCLVAKQEGTQERIEPSDHRMRHVQNATRVGELLEHVSSFRKNANANELTKFFASLEHHALAVSANTDEIRLLNLWTALESLVLGEGLPIQKLLEWVPPAMGLRNTIKQIRAVGNYVKLWWQLHDSPALGPLFPTSTKERITDSDFYDVLSLDPGTPSIVALFNAVEQPLIRYRMKKLNDLLRKPPALIAHAKTHCQNVDWQLRRIYRARNKIAHQGGVPTALRHLVQHLHTYYVLTLRGLLEDAVEFGYVTFATSFHHRKLIWETFVRDAATANPAALKAWVLSPEKFFRQ